MIALSVAAALAIGFAAGLLTFKIKQRWCGACGLELCCPQCGPPEPAVSSPEGEQPAPLQGNP